LTQLNKSLAKLGPAAWELGRRLDGPESDVDSGGEMSRIVQSLQTMQGHLTEFASRIGEVRERTERLESQMPTWITCAVVLISAVCFWVAVSQVSVLVHASTWWKAGKEVR
jgi:hypothetical protein